MKKDLPEIAKNIQLARKALGLSRQKLAEMCSFSPSTISNYENGIRKPEIEALLILSNQLKKSPDFLLCGKESNVLPADLIEKKVIGSVSAGNLKELIETDQNGDLETVYLPRKYLDDQKYFVLKIDGDSMTSDRNKHSFNDGNFMVFDKQIAATSGDYALIYNEHDKTSVFKKLVKDGNTYLLKPLNPTYPTRLMTKEEVVIGVAVCYQPRSEFLK